MRDYQQPSRSSTSTTHVNLQEAICPICMERIENISHPDNCIHTFCHQCIVKWAEINPVCPLCREPFLTVQEGGTEFTETEDTSSSVGTELSEEEVRDESPSSSYVTTEQASTSASSTQLISSESSDEELSSLSDFTEDECDSSPPLSSYLSHVSSQYRGVCSAALTTGTQHHPANTASGKSTKTTHHLDNQSRENSNGEHLNAKRKHPDHQEAVTPQTSRMSSSEEPLEKKTKQESCPIPTRQMTEFQAEPPLPEPPLCERHGQKRKRGSDHTEHTQAKRTAPERQPPTRPPRSEEEDDSSDEPGR
ncbi:hypothetical protein XELAEV_18035670mg [Xenopus laevis]|uniref:RING-type E3 ubiquitin transferase n=1 Tax=Xenopus laevis TaxID=8355 RepID=A0A974CIC3_XENLA|nr:hypothetical protein XELAEV_18035670mg [Xenopus laevis]